MTFPSTTGSGALASSRPSPKLNNIVLTGFMGTGKSTIGPLVAETLGWAFVDADDVIEAKVGMTIPEIFDRQGEPGFRQIEASVCVELATRHDHVIATGGGMLVNHGNLAVMRSTGLVICLVAKPDVIEQRLGDGPGRPLAAGWQSLYDQRRDAYAVIEHQLETSSGAPEELAREVVRLWQSESP